MESKYDYVVFDIETTGLHPDSDQICEIAAIGVKDGLPQGTFSTLVAIEGSMPEAAGRVNGITDDMLKGAPAIGDALDAFLDFIGDDAVLAGHNIVSFDIPFVANAAAKSGRVFIYPYVIDTLEAARELWPDLPGRSMDSLRGILGIERTDAHRALADCYDELAVLNAELSVIMQSYARKMDYCRGELLRIAGEIAEEIQAELDRQARESMMTISLDMTPTLSADGSKLAVRVANVEENRFDQLIEVEQDGKVIGSYKGLKPGEKLDEIDVTGAKTGDATVTVQAMEDGEPSGNPSGFEVTITASE